jgi:hypothetical protein
MRPKGADRQCDVEAQRASPGRLWPGRRRGGREHSGVTGGAQFIERHERDFERVGRESSAVSPALRRDRSLVIFQADGATIRDAARGWERGPESAARIDARSACGRVWARAPFSARSLGSRRCAEITEAATRRLSTEPERESGPTAASGSEQGSPAPSAAAKTARTDAGAETVTDMAADRA